MRKNVRFWGWAQQPTPCPCLLCHNVLVMSCGIRVARCRGRRPTKAVEIRRGGGSGGGGGVDTLLAGKYLTDA
jgi:hypothetical protein